jgi:hypothetical protein
MSVAYSAQPRRTAPPLTPCPHGLFAADPELSPQLRHELDRFGVTDKIHADHFFDSVDAARAAFSKTASGHA